GLLAAHRLAQVGIDHTIFEKDAEVGGTWFENTYPGCRVDVPNHFYSYSFSQHRWPSFFSTQPALLEYFRRFADEQGIRPRIRFRTEVLRTAWDDDGQQWAVTTRSADGQEVTERFDA